MIKKYGLLFFGAGLLLLIIQFLMLAFQFINGDLNATEVFSVATEESGFKEFITLFWSGFIGSLMLVVLFIRRLTKGPEAMLTLVGALLWVIQILSRYESQKFLDFILLYIFGILGIGFVGIAALCDAYIIKSKNSDE